MSFYIYLIKKITFLFTENIYFKTFGFFLFLKSHLGSWLFSVDENKYENLILEKSLFPILVTFQIQSS